MKYDPCELMFHPNNRSSLFCSVTSYLSRISSLQNDTIPVNSNAKLFPFKN